jgi:GxxExxY protein
MDVDSLSNLIIGVAIIVHKELGPGLLESAYEPCMTYEFAARGIRTERQKPLPVHYKGVRLDCGYRMDMVVEDLIVLEFKSVSKVDPIHEAQMQTYLRLSGLTVGLILNFNVRLLKDGIRRFVNGYVPASSRLCVESKRR